MSRTSGAVVLAVLLGGCMPFGWHQAKLLEGKYRSGSPGEGWSSVEPGGADHAWVNRGAGASLYIDSNCGSRFQEARTVDLATELVAGLQGVTQDLEVERSIGPRSGVVRTHTGRLDGVPVRLGVAVVNHDWCTYDFVLITPLGTLDELWPAFEAVLAGFDPVAP